MTGETGIYLGFLTAGLLGSLHCIGMCGPIVVAVCGAQQSVPVTVEGRRSAGEAARTAAGALWYHAGRVLTYALLGATAGMLGLALQEASAFAGVQGWVGLVLGLATVAAGLAALILPRRCGSRESQGRLSRGAARMTSLVGSLTGARSPSARMLLGGIMGFLPCGLVYAMLIGASALAHPVRSAAAMICFGLGTLPALSAVAAASVLAPLPVRKYGNQLAAIAVIVVGGVFAWRGWIVVGSHDHEATPTCPLCEPGTMAAAPESP